MITIENVRKTFHTKDGAVGAVDGIDLEVGSGTFFTLLGPSGCGKTTTMRIVAGLEKPDEGRIAIDGETMFSIDKRIHVPANRRRVSMVFQSYAIWPHMTVAANVAYPLRAKRFPRSEIAGEVEQVLKLVGMEGMGGRHATRLSGGQQQRVALARALVGSPQVILLDEPLSNLDAQLRTQMRFELKELQSRVGVTTLYVTHDQQEALSMSDELIVMNQGRIVQRGRPSDVYNRPRNRFVAEFIGATNILKGSISGPLKSGLNRMETQVGFMIVDAPQSIPGEVREFLVSIRPERLHIEADDGLAVRTSGEGVNRLQGVIENRAFLGDVTDYSVRVDNVVLHIKEAAREPIPPGTQVSIEVAAEDCIVLVSEDIV